MANKKQRWTMPDWMEPFRPIIGNTGGNPVEEMMNDESDPRVNLPRCVLAVAVKSQVGMLADLRRRGLLNFAHIEDGKLPPAQ